MMNNLLDNYGDSKRELSSTLDNYSLDELVNLYITYSRSKYFMEHDNMEEILKYISSYILRNLSKLSFLEVIDLYSKMMLEVIDLEKLRESNSNIVNIRTGNLKDDFFLEMQAKIYNLGKENYIKKYRQEIEYLKKNEQIYEQIFNLLDDFQKDIFNYLNTYVEQISNPEVEHLLEEINKVINHNSIEIIKRVELRQDRKKVAIYSKFNEKSILEVYDKLDTTKLEQQNYVYGNFQAVLKDLNKEKSK